MAVDTQNLVSPPPMAAAAGGDGRVTAAGVLSSDPCGAGRVKAESAVQCNVEAAGAASEGVLRMRSQHAPTAAELSLWRSGTLHSPSENSLTESGLATRGSTTWHRRTQACDGFVQTVHDHANGPQHRGLILVRETTFAACPVLPVFSRRCRDPARLKFRRYDGLPIYPAALPRPDCRSSCSPHAIQSKQGR